MSVFSRNVAKNTINWVYIEVITTNVFMPNVDWQFNDEVEEFLATRRDSEHNDWALSSTCQDYSLGIYKTGFYFMDASDAVEFKLRFG